MLAYFTDLPSSAKVWGFIANRKLSIAEYNIAIDYLNKFVKNWESHHQPVKGSFLLIDSQLLLLAADESEVTIGGCSMDSLNRTVKELGNMLNVDFFDRMLIPIFENDAVTTIPMSAIEQAIQSRQLSKDTTIFNTSVFSVKELQENGLLKAENSWLKRYLP